MCGIYGSTRLFDRTTIQKKLEIAQFRGPDNSHYRLVNEKLIMGHNRLSIFDLEERSNQPFVYNDIVIVFNGEIYNFLDLKKQLIELNYRFSTSSDTEVVCAMYKEYGDKCLNHFIGMFSFVIYDERNNFLFGARDRLGQKPFFYRVENGEFEFASNLKQIEIGNKLKLDSNNCKDYFHFGHFVDPATPFERVYKLKPGNSFFYHLETKSLQINRYWSVDRSPKDNRKISYREHKKNLSEILTSAVELRLNADVPVGLFLSGGIDSSLITSIAKSVRSDISTYSIKFNDKNFDESEASSSIANHLGTNHNTFSCDLDRGKKLIETMFDFYDEPFADISSIPSMLLSSEVKRHVSVALTGDGADEFFLGYDRYRWMNDIKGFYKVPYFIRKGVGALLTYPNDYKMNMIGKGISYKSIDTLYLRMMSTFKDSYIRKKITAEITRNFQSKFQDKSVLDACSLTDIDYYLNSDINTKVDRASMAYSLEARSPFMDHRVVEYARLIPTKMKYNKRCQKYILKDLLADYLPKNLFDRSKMGFGVPLEDWLKKDLKPLAFYCLEELKKLNLEFIRYHKVDDLFNEFYLHNANHSAEIWKMMAFVLWHQNAIKR